MSRSNDKEETKDNPFSFRNFLTNPSASHVASSARSNSSSRDHSNNVGDISDRSTNSNSNSSNNPSPSTSRRNAAASSERDNPYSFKRFLQQDSVRPVQSVRGDDNCIMVHGDLPDFVQDYFGGSAGGTGDGIEGCNLDNLPDFTLTSEENGVTGCNGTSRGLRHTNHFPPPPPPSLLMHHGTENESLSDAEEEDLNSRGAAAPCLNGAPRSTTSATLVLPDFLSDMNGGHPGTHDSDPLIQAPVADSESDNDALRRALRQMQQQLQEKDCELDRLRRLLREKESREADETAAMEKILKQVETNLQTATERASRAESHNKRLKEELKSLRSQQTCGEPSPPTEEVALRARHIGLELGQSVNSAEHMLRQLLSGLDKVKLVSENLQSLDKFTELPR